MAGSWGEAGWGQGRSSLSHPNVPPLQLCSPHLAPGCACAQANNHPEKPHGTGARQSQDIAGYPNIFQIWGFGAQIAI